MLQSGPGGSFVAVGPTGGESVAVGKSEVADGLDVTVAVGVGVGVGVGVAVPVAPGGGSDDGTAVPSPDPSGAKVGSNVLVAEAVGVGVAVGSMAASAAAVSNNPSACTVAATAVSTNPGSTEPPIASALAVDSASMVARREVGGVAVCDGAASFPGSLPISDQAVTGKATIARTASPKLARLRAQSELPVSFGAGRTCVSGVGPIDSGFGRPVSGSSEMASASLNAACKAPTVSYRRPGFLAVARWITSSIASGT